MANETPLDNPNVQKFLDFIGKAEGADYNVIVGGKRFDDFSKHPGIVGLRTKEGPSTAAGRYQITKTTYDDFAPKLGITDFSPESQDRIAVEIFKREKALGDIQKGDFEAAINKLGGRFASLPSSKYSQPKKSWDFVQAELGTVAQGPSSTQKMAPRAQPKPFKVAQGPQAAPKAAKMALTDLPQSYRSALALNYLVDSDPEDELMAKATELLQASMPEQGGGPAGGTVLQKYAAQMPEINPYQFLQPPPTDQGPARMAAGGLVVGGTTLPFIPGASLTQGEKDWIAAREAEYADYNTAVDKYNAGVSEYQKLVDAYNESIKPYQSEMDAYTKAVDDYNKAAELYNQRSKVFGDVRYATSNYGATPYNLGVSYSAEENRRKNQMIRDAGLKPGSSGLYDVSFFLPEDGLYEWEQTRGTPGGVIYYGDLYKRGGAYPGEFTAKPPGDPPPAFTGVEPTAPTNVPYTQEQYQQYVTQAQKDAALRAQALQVASDPERFNLSGLSAFGSAESPNPVVARRPGAIPRIPRMFAEGGEVTGEELFQQMIGGTPNEPQAAPQAMATPMQSEVPQLDQFGRVVRDPVAPAPQRTVLQELIGAGEAAATVGTSVLSAVPAALVGAKELLTPGQTRQGAEAAMMGTMDRFTYAPRGEAGRENLDNLGKFLQATKLDAALPQTQLMSMRVNPGAARYLGERAREGTEAAVMPGLRAQTQNPQLQATDVYGAMLTSPAETVKAGALAVAPKQKEAIDRSLLFPSAERPFVGELERRVADLPGPVQKEQFINSLKKTAREHEIVRLEQALENYGPKDKLTPNQIMSLLKDTSPQRYQLEVLEPQANRFYAGQDTPYPSLPLGTANLLLEPKQLQKEIVGFMDEAQSIRSSMFADAIASDETKLKEFLTNINKLSDRVEGFDTELSRKLKQSTEDFYEKVEPIAAASRVRQYVSYPSLSSNPDGLSNVVFNDLKGTLPSKIKGVLSNRGIDFTDNSKVSVTALFLAAREAAMSDYLKSIKALADTESDVGTYLKYTMSASERDKLNEMLSPNATWREELAPFYKAAQETDANKALPLSERHTMGNQIGERFATRVNEMLSDFDYNITAARKAVAEDLRAMPQMILDSDLVQQNKLFEGTHTSVVRKNPISFSRYVDLDAAQYNLPDTRGAMLFTELQSDRRKSVKKGVPGVEEAYPGMAKLSEDTLRELMVKSAVAATARRGKGIALFPSTDSKKAGLYSNIDRVAKKVAKDLGEGYQARQFDVVNEAGDTIKRWGIVLPDNASELPQKGIRFAKGGLVDRSLYDRA
jgi:muramidase (phage lysozyme)